MTNNLLPFSARQAARELFKIIEQIPQDKDYFTTETGGTIRIYTKPLDEAVLNHVLEFSKNDNLIIATAAQVQKDLPNERVPPIS